MKSSSSMTVGAMRPADANKRGGKVKKTPSSGSTTSLANCRGMGAATKGGKYKP